MLIVKSISISKGGLMLPWFFIIEVGSGEQVTEDEGRNQKAFFGMVFDRNPFPIIVHLNEKYNKNSIVVLKWTNNHKSLIYLKYNQMLKMILIIRVFKIFSRISHSIRIVKNYFCSIFYDLD